MSALPLSRPGPAALSPVRTPQQLLWRRLRQSRTAMLGLIVIVLVLALATFVPLLTGYDPGKTDLINKFSPPSPAHWFGTDELGRDLFVRLWAGARISLLIGVATMSIAIALGTLIGAAAGFYGGLVDNLLMRFTDVMLTIPQLFLLLIFGQLLRATNNPELSSGPVPIILIIGILAWMPVARLVRGQFLSLKTLDYVDAARALGVANSRIILRHILPNAISPIIVAATLRVGAAIITESTLSFLGYGVQAPTPTWGNMLKNAQSFITTSPWTAIVPGLAIFATVLAINFVGDGLRDALDPRTLVRARRQG
ncbi:MAG: ABC transporter permease [Thermoflexales bacterium]|nr:ABC transporter permease [Thermoflexales bacterium]